MTAVTFNFDFPEGRKAPLFCQFEGELGPQPAFITLNPDTREVSTDYTSEVGTAVPMAVWHNLELRFSVLASVSGKALTDFCQDHAHLFERICNGFESVWDGNNYVGRYSQDALDAQDDLTSAIERELKDELISVWRIGEYLAEGNNPLQEEWPEGQTLEEAAAALFEETISGLGADVELYGDQDDVEEYLLTRMDNLCGNIPQGYKAVLQAIDAQRFDDDDFKPSGNDPLATGKASPGLQSGPC
jgi:hypothetical protein